MKLKRIGLHGFKSFKDKINLEFEHPITAIVGPNGSGKSNIADGIRWVLGEQSAKSLRGTKMEDIIFAGTEKVKPVNVAQVSMTFDNESQWLPLEYKDITIERRVYRNGESNYYLNKSKCKLKDIRELFLDTGIGKDGYSIIGQGRIDGILNSKSEERREIFEEASGISKLKYKKIESIKKLDKVRENVKTIEELLNVRSAELNYLKKEAQRASKGIALEKELFAKDKNLALHDIALFKEKKAQYEETAENLKISLTEDKKDKFSADKELESLSVELTDLQEKMEELEKEIHGLEIKKEKLKSNLNINTEKISFNQNEKSRLKTEISRYEESVLNSKKEKENTLNEKSAGADEVQALEIQYKKMKSSLETEKKAENENSSRYHLFMDNFEKEKEKYNELNILKETNKQFALNEEKNSSEYEIKAGEIDEEINQFKKKILLYNDNSVILSNKINRSKEKIIYLEEKIDSDRRKLQEAEKKKTNLEISGKDLRNRYNMLLQIKDNYEGYYRQVAIFLKELRKDKGMAEKSLGTLADLIEVENHYEKVIEVLLSGNLQSVVTQTDQDAKDLVRFLKEKKIGRLTFLPIESIKASRKKEIIEDADILCIASDVVKCDKPFRNIIEYFLNRTLIVKDMHTAIKVKKKYPNYRIATIEADLINTWGSIVGGYKKTQNKGVSIVNRENEIENLKSSMDKKSGEFEKINQHISKLLEGISLDQKEYDTMLSLLEEKKKEQDNIHRQKEFFDTQIEILAVKKEELNKYLDRQKENIFTENHEKELQNLEKSIQEKAKLKEEMISELEIQKDKINRLEMEIYKVDNLLESKKRDLNINENILSKINERILHENNLLEADRTHLLEINQLVENLQKENQRIEENLDKADKEYSKKNKENPLLKERYKKLAEDRERKIEWTNKLDKKIIKMEFDLQTAAEKVEEYKNSILSEKSRIKEEYDEEITDIEAFVPDETLSLTELRKEIKGMKKSLFQIGEYRKESIPEYEKEIADFENITAQKKDLIETTINLEKIIQGLDSTMKANFIENFRMINENFNRIFKVLFNGGTASLIIDESDVLSAGIEIVAEPPGKKLQNLNLLSGGERSLTAVALLFAIFENHPSPFCILDEIDAALDEANIFRYTKYLKELSKYTQFIMITHRKSTMEIADVLYGVSMQKEGISNVITLDLK